MIPIANGDRLRTSCGGGEAGHLLHWAWDVLLSGCGGVDQASLQGQVVVQGASGVLPTVLFVHPGQIPRPREQLLHSALGHVRC